MEEERKKDRRVLPFEDYARFGNFKIKKVNLLISDKGTAQEEDPKAELSEENIDKRGLYKIEAVKIASLEELWCVRIPSNRVMYRFIVDLYEENNEESDKILNTLFCNISNVTSLGDGLYHDVVIHAAMAYMNRRDEVSSKEDKVKEYKRITDSILADMLKDLEGYTPKKKIDETKKEFRQSVLADELRAKTINENEAS